MSKKTLIIISVGLPVLATVLVWAWPHDAEYYYNRGEDRLTATDEDGGGAAAYRARAGLQTNDAALADFGRAIELKPTNKLNYISRAYFWADHQQLEKAVADLDQAIQVNPNAEDLFGRRAKLRHELGDFTGMVADLARESEVFSPAPTNPDSLKVASLLAMNPERMLHRLLEICNLAIQRDTNFAQGYFHRGSFKYLANDPAGALQDFQRCSEFPDAHVQDYAAIHVWLVRTQQGDTNAATAGLLNHFGTRLHPSTNDWPAQIARFLTNQTSELEFFAAIEKNNTAWDQSECWFYTAMKHLCEGDHLKVAEYLRKSQMTETRPYVVAISSQIELGRLGP